MKILKKFVASMLIFIMVFSVSGFTNVFAVEDSNKYKQKSNYISVESYRDFLEERISNNQQVEDTKDVLSDFENLSSNEREKFISYINNPDLNLEILKALSENKTYVAFNNGDIVVSSNEQFDQEDSIQARSSIQSRTATASRSVSVLGLKVFEYSGEIRYKHNGSSIRSIDHANIWISRNFLPLVDFSWNDSSTYGVGSRTAHHIEYCTWSFVHEKIGLTYGSHQIEITGNVNNNTTFSVR